MQVRKDNQDQSGILRGKMMSLILTLVGRIFLQNTECKQLRRDLSRDRSQALRAVIEESSKGF